MDNPDRRPSGRVVTPYSRTKQRDQVGTRFHSQDCLDQFSVALSVAVAVEGYEPDPVGAGERGRGGRGTGQAAVAAGGQRQRWRHSIASSVRNYGDVSHHCKSVNKGCVREE